MYKGYNQHRQLSGRVQKKSFHAEQCSLLLALKRNDKYASFRRNKILSGKSTMYVVRLMNYTTNLPENQKYWLGCSKCCKDCEKTLHKHGVKIIKYTDIINDINVLVEMRIVY